MSLRSRKILTGIVIGMFISIPMIWVCLHFNGPLSLANFRSRILLSLGLPSLPGHFQRPYGMAPAAFDAYIRACNRAHIHPDRIGQTIGDAPRSVGYHKKDGTLIVHGAKIDYCTAVDLGTFDLDVPHINRFVEELHKQGFAAWYRHGPKWKNGEHIHAVYAFLPMKIQLRRQVLLFLREQRDDGQPIVWERKLRRSRTFRRYFS